MRLAALALLPLLAACGTAQPRGGGVMSIGLCADQYVLALLPPDRIASVTALAQTGSPPIRALAARVRTNRQRAEDVLAQAPDLIVADAFTDPATRALLGRFGHEVVDLPPARDLAAIRATTLTLGTRLGALPRARMLVTRWEDALARLKPVTPRPLIASWDGSGRLPPRGTLYDAALERAGARNLGRDRHGGGFDVEALLLARPDLLLHDGQVLDTPGRQAERLGHPLVRRLYAGRQVTIPQEAFVCGTPATIEAVIALNARLAAR